MKKTLEHSLILLTGANSGLGLALLNQLIPIVKKIVVLDVQTDKLELLKTNNPKALDFFTFDLSQDFGIEDLAFLDSYSFDLVIHNAGITHIKLFENHELSQFDRVMQINFRAPVIITKYLINNGLKGFVCINSIAGKAPLIGRTAYVASKHALEGFAKTLATESNLEVMCVYPSFINTGIRTVAQSEGRKGFRTKNTTFLEPEFVATKIIQAWIKAKKTVYIGSNSQLAVWLNFLCPKWYVYLMRNKNKRLWKS